MGNRQLEVNEIFNLYEFHKSTSEELQSIKNRVRNLIGDSNWGEEGRYKETILKNVIRRFLPSKYVIGSGFVVKNFNGKLECSTQIDILIFDSSYPVLLSEGDFYIVTPNSVKAAIEVKTNIENQNLSKTIRKMNNIGLFLYKHQLLGTNPFIGIFSFDGYPNLENLEDRVKESIIAGIGCKTFLNHISLNEDIFIRYNDRNGFSVYKLNNLSFSYFISNLIYYVTDSYIENESSTWFMGNKEPNLMFEIQLTQHPP